MTLNASHEILYILKSIQLSVTSTNYLKKENWRELIGYL